MLSTLRGSTSTRSRFPKTTCSTTPPKRSASSRASRSASSTSEAETVELDDASHFLVEDSPDAVTDAIEGFLR